MARPSARPRVRRRRLDHVDRRDELHDESYRVESGWSRLTREAVFESQPCRYELAVDGEIHDEYEFHPSCTDFEDVVGLLDIVIAPSDIDCFPTKFGRE